MKQIKNIFSSFQIIFDQLAKTGDQSQLLMQETKQAEFINKYGKSHILV